MKIFRFPSTGIVSILKGTRGYSRVSKKIEAIPRQGNELIFGVKPVVFALKNSLRQPYRLFLDESVVVKWKNQSNNTDENCKDKNLLSPEFHYFMTLIQTEPKFHEISQSLVSSSFLSNLSKHLPNEGVCLESSSLPLSTVTIDNLTDHLQTWLNRNVEKQANQMIRGSEIILYLAGVKDVMNFSAILRSAVRFGVRRILLPATHSCRPISVVSRVSDGATDQLDFYLLEDPSTIFKNLREHKDEVLLVGTSEKSNILPCLELSNLLDKSSSKEEGRLHLDAAVNSGKQIILIMGAEDEGIPSDILQLCDVILNLSTQQKHLSCLNVSVATGVFIQHLSILLNNVKHSRV